MQTREATAASLTGDQMNNKTTAAPSNRPMQRPVARQCVLTLSILALAVSAAMACGPPAAAGQLGSVDILTRHDGQVLPVYPSGGRNWAVGTPGQEYSIRY